MKVEIYTDGSIVGGNPGGTGGWSAVLVANSGWKHRILSGYEHDSTNNRMELSAAIEGLQALKGRREVTVYSDSEYLILGFTKGRVEKWANNNWRTKKKAVPNSDLWRQLNDQDIFHDVTWTHIRSVHKDPEKLEEGEKWAALAHQLAISEARIARAAKEKGFEGYTTPESLEGRTALLGVIRNLPDPPDPPHPERGLHYAVYERLQKSQKDGLPTFTGPVYIPIEPSRCLGPDGNPDGGKWECQKAARSMNKSDDTKLGSSFRARGRPRFLAIPRQWRGTFTLELDEYDTLRREVDESYGTARAV